jgi:hypothetical protein
MPRLLRLFELEGETTRSCRVVERGPARWCVAVLGRVVHVLTDDEAAAACP